MANQTDLLIATSLKSQADFNTPVTPVAGARPGTLPSHTQILASRTASTFQNSFTTTDNSDEATGQREPTENYIAGHDTVDSLSLRLNAEDMPRVAYRHFGAISSALTAAAAGSDPAVYTHSIARQNLATSLQLPAYELVFDAGDPIQERHISMCSQELAIDFVPNESKTEDPTMRMTWASKGSGLSYDSQDGQNLIWQPAAGGHIERQTSRNLLTRAHLSAVVGDYDGSGAAVAGTTNILTDCTLRKMTATFRNTFSPQEICPGAGRLFYTVAGDLWQPTTAYTLGAIKVFNRRIYEVTVAGTSGAVGPTHTTGTATDGTVTWQFKNYRGIANWVATTAVLQYDRVVYNDRHYLVTVAGTLAATGPTHTSGSATNGTATLRYIGKISESGEIGSQLLLSERTAEINMIVDAKPNSRFLDYARGQIPFDLVFGAKGGFIRTGHQFETMFHAYKITYNSQSIEVVDNIYRLNLALKLNVDQVQNKVIDMYVKSTTAGTEYV